MARLFGTDGVRGVAGTELTAELATGLGRAAVTVLGRHGAGRAVVVVGRDPRASGVWLERALTDGIRSAGGDVLLMGVEPTPAIAFTTVDLGASAGVVISASHNPPEDNGIKFFSRDGMKLPDPIEDEIEAALDAPAVDAVGARRGADASKARGTAISRISREQRSPRSTGCASSSIARTGPRRSRRPHCLPGSVRRSPRSTPSPTA